MSTEKNPILSLCIPTYNRATFLDETLQSIEKNICDNTNEIEIVISHNPSGDNTADIIERYRKSFHLKYIRDEINIGPERNLCRVIAAASGKYVWLFGDDDPLVEDICAHLLRMVQAHPELGYVFVPRELAFTDLSPTPDGIQPADLNGDLYFENGRDLYEAHDGQIAGLIGFYGCNIVQKRFGRILFTSLIQN